MSEALLTPDLLRSMPLPRIAGEAGKEARGRVVVLAGGKQNPGAAMLCATAAYRAGAGKVQLAADEAVAQHLAFALLEARVIQVPTNAGGEPTPAAIEAMAPFLDRADAIVVGPGMMDEANAADLAAVLAAAAPAAAVVVDAGALTGLKDRMQALKPLAGRLVVTPHTGEMAKLLGLDEEEVRADCGGIARRTAAEWSAVVALKGKVTFVACPDGRTWRHEGGSIGLGVAGSGDVLAGAMTGLLARGAAPELAAVWAVHAHGAAGRALGERIGRLGFLAREVADELPRHLDG
jgi:hydroxyethylthiazole kinase-like uncharacterized protein yjeF